MSAVLAEASRTSGLAALAEPHHDGSELGVLQRPRELGDEAVVRLRLPHAHGADRVLVRYTRDGEPRVAEGAVDGQSGAETWWRASFPVWNPIVRYRWLLVGGEVGFAWVNGLGRAEHDVPDADDFVIALGGAGPDWHLRSVAYQIFPDRFARSGARRTPPEWAVARSWDELPTGRGRDTAYEWFGGDLGGVEERLDHVEALGADLIYLTPFFPAGTTHRYDATTFDHVDPLLGGDEALISLTRAAHARGIRVVGDITPNHTGDGHEWFRRARSDPSAPERDFYLWDESLPLGYESWLGVRSLPKLNWGSAALRERFAGVVRRYLEPPFELDGWRIDVANMTGRWRDADLNHEAAAWLREAAGDKLLVAEHGHDFRADLAPPGWNGVMNYSGFMRPLWTWLRRDDPPEELRRMYWGIPIGVPRLDGSAVAGAMRAFAAGITWEAALHSWVLLDSHDVARFRTVSGSRARQLVGVGLQMTTPGVPMVFAGDEVGVEGDWGEDARRPFPWDRLETWDRELLDRYRELIALRRSAPALARGGMRFAYVGPDALAYLRETADERLLCLAARAEHAPVRLPLAALGAQGLEPVVGGEARIEHDEALLPADGPAFHVWRLT
jgi:alpha-glucosidase